LKSYRQRNLCNAELALKFRLKWLVKKSRKAVVQLRSKERRGFLLAAWKRQTAKAKEDLDGKRLVLKRKVIKR
jgi:hypothetical protein